MTRGIYAAVVLAGYGLPVAPFDLEAMRILAKPNNDVDTVLALFSRDPGDTISTVGLLDPDPMAGAIMLYAGWQIDGQPSGAPNDGYLPVPRQLLRAVLNDPMVAYSFWHPVAGAPSSLSH